MSSISAAPPALWRARKRRNGRCQSRNQFPTLLGPLPSVATGPPVRTQKRSIAYNRLTLWFGPSLAQKSQCIATANGTLVRTGSPGILSRPSALSGGFLAYLPAKGIVNKQYRQTQKEPLMKLIQTTSLFFALAVGLAS